MLDEHPEERNVAEWTPNTSVSDALRAVWSESVIAQQLNAPE